MRENGHDTQHRGPGLFISKPTSWQSGAHTNIMTGWRRKEPPGDSNHRPSAYKAESLSIREWLRCSKWAEFGPYHTARRLVKGKEKLKRVSCTQKKRAGTGSSWKSPAWRGSKRWFGRKKTSLKERLCFEACGALKKAQDQDLASTLVKRAFFSIEITSVFGALKFPDF